MYFNLILKFDLFKHLVVSPTHSPSEAVAGGRKYFFDPYTHFRPAEENDDDGDIMHT